ncbi:hypothetical protein IGI37_001671 [Enterococcus sp. AZ194]
MVAIIVMLLVPSLYFSYRFLEKRDTEKEIQRLLKIHKHKKKTDYKMCMHCIMYCESSEDLCTDCKLYFDYSHNWD